MRFTHRHIGPTGTLWTDQELRHFERDGATWLRTHKQCPDCSSAIYALYRPGGTIQYALACKHCPAPPDLKPETET